MPGIQLDCLAFVSGECIFSGAAASEESSTLLPVVTLPIPPLPCLKLRTFHYSLVSQEKTWAWRGSGRMISALRLCPDGRLPAGVALLLLLLSPPPPQDPLGHPGWKWKSPSPPTARSWSLSSSSLGKPVTSAEPWWPEGAVTTKPSGVFAVSLCGVGAGSSSGFPRPSLSLGVIGTQNAYVCT